MVRDSTSSLKDVCFLSAGDFLRPAVKLLCLGCWVDIFSSKELSSSPDEPPSMNKPPFLLESSVLGCRLDLAGTGVGARWVCDLNEDEI